MADMSVLDGNGPLAKNHIADPEYGYKLSVAVGSLCSPG